MANIKMYLTQPEIEFCTLALFPLPTDETELNPETMSQEIISTIEDLEAHGDEFESGDEETDIDPAAMKAHLLLVPVAVWQNILPIWRKEYAI